MKRGLYFSKQNAVLCLTLSVMFFVTACGGDTQDTNNVGSGSGMVMDSETENDKDFGENISVSDDFVWLEDEFDTFVPDKESEGLIFELNRDEESYSCVGLGDCMDKYVVIPSVYEELPVTRVARNGDASWKAGTMSGIVIPNSVTEIDSETFNGCFNLERVSIPDSIEAIQRWTFCDSSLTRIDIPGSVKLIEDAAFENCHALLLVNLQEGLESIGFGAFSGCENLVSIELPNTLSDIGDSAFMNCGSLKKIKIPEGISGIGGAAFCCCRSLSGIELPDGITTIGPSAFTSCQNLTNIDLPQNLESIEASAFDDCGLAEIFIPENVNQISSPFLYQCNSLAKITVADGNAAYASLDGVLYSKDMKILHTYPAGKKEKSFSVPDGIVVIGDYAFSGMLLDTLHIPATVTEIGLYFMSAPLKEIDVVSGNLSFTSSDGVLFSKNMDILICYPHAHPGETYIIPDTVTTIASGAINGTYLKSIIIPESVTVIEDNAFAASYELTDIQIPKTVKRVGDFAFGSCQKLKNVTIDGMDTELGMNIFISVENDVVLNCRVGSIALTYAEENGIPYTLIE